MGNVLAKIILFYSKEDKTETNLVAAPDNATAVKVVKQIRIMHYPDKKTQIQKEIIR